MVIKFEIIWLELGSFEFVESLNGSDQYVGIVRMFSRTKLFFIE